MDGFDVSSSFMAAHSMAKVTLNSEVGLYISILGGEGMMTPQHPMVGGMFIKVKLADIQCKSVIPSLQATEVHYTNAVTAKPNPDWGGEEIFLQVINHYLMQCGHE
jgi:cobalamin biosynthesis protein CbiD